MKVFKDYTQDQLMILPPDLGELVPEKHLVRVVSKAIDRIKNKKIEALFKGGGAPSYHPKLMLKVIIYGYCCKLFSCRRIARALRQDVTFMWLAGMMCPDFNTVNRFRSNYLSPIIEDVFTEVLDFLHEHGYIKFEDYFVDGTKLEADAGKYTYVWKKNTQRYKKQLKERVAGLLKEIDQINEDEDRIYGDRDLEELGEDSELKSKDVKDFAEKLDKKIEQVTDKKKIRSLKSRSKRLSKESEKLNKYEQQEDLLGSRNSYSKTDTDATFMRMKDDSLRAGYNVQLSTENQFITNYSTSQNASDSASFKDHLQRILERGAKYKPKNYMGDCGYGCEENYELMEQHEIGNYLKFNTFHYEQTKKARENIFHRDNMSYDEANDHFICPNDKRLIYRETTNRKTATGYECETRIYECEDCTDCPLKSQCTKAKGNRKLRISPNLEIYKEQARENLNSKKGIELRKRRGFEVETPFGDWKRNQDYRRFHLRGHEKVDLETGYLSIAHNLRKVALIQAKKRAA
jgi:transposase/predicted RNA-binding Zn-ribbon protein involved in translation (DUF1610 family)